MRREKHVPLGGPVGGDGGRGGDVVLIADRRIGTLLAFRNRSVFEAGSGGDSRASKDGRDGETLEVKVPVGTVAIEIESGDVLVDLKRDGARFVIARGGRGGSGNAKFVRATRQAPKFAQMGAPSEEVAVRLELRLLADVGLVGLPNAGKSTFLSAVSAAKPKVASYPFTTIEPNLGVAEVGDISFTVADLPGLIEGAAEGHGLGDRFLKHASRTSLLLHLVESLPMDDSDPAQNYKTIRTELQSHSPELAVRDEIVVLSKIDLVDSERATAIGCEVGAGYAVSAVTGAGMKELMAEVARRVAEHRDAQTDDDLLRPEAPAIRTPGRWDAEQIDPGVFEATGDRLVRLVAMTDLTNRDALRQMHRTLSKIGVIKRLRELGAEPGDTVVIGDTEFEFAEW